MSSFKSVKSDSVEYLVSPMLEGSELVRHFFSTKTGGISTGEFSSLNLGVYSDDNIEDVNYNMKLIFNAAKMHYDNKIYLKQIHSSSFYMVDSKNLPKYMNAEGDAIITLERNVPIGIFTADCVPILILDRKKGIIASVHAGWKGTFGKIIEKVIKYMINKLGTNPKDIVAAIGPSIGPCCFKVGSDVAVHFNSKFCKNGDFYVDLWSENIEQIILCGVPKENIDLSSLCSKCNEDLFYSYRRDNGKTGRMGSFIELI